MCVFSLLTSIFYTHNLYFLVHRAQDREHRGAFLCPYVRVPPRCDDTRTVHQEPREPIGDAGHTES